VRLGMSVARLRAEMRLGIAYSVVARGMGEDAGLRLTFRYRGAHLDDGGPTRRDRGRGAVVAGRLVTTSRLRKASSRPAEARWLVSSPGRSSSIIAAILQDREPVLQLLRVRHAP